MLRLFPLFYLLIILIFQLTMVQACFYSCLTCTGPQVNQCSSCLAANHRALVQTSCLCQGSYCDDGISAMCVLCYYACLTCASANANTQQCLSCPPNSNRFLVSPSPNNCQCNDGYFDDGGTPSCFICNYTCLTCNLVASTCTSCLSSNLRTFVSSTSKCPCNNGYYNNQVALCAPCDYSCLTCYGGTKVCATCSSSNQRTLSTTTFHCDCNSGYYDGGLAKCFYSTCYYTCQTCTDATNQCFSCSSSNYRTLAGASPNLCSCNTGYYDNSVSTCAQCNYTCYTCTDSSPNCVSCSSTNHRTLAGQSPNTCPCNNRYYNNGVGLCVACHYSCYTCSDTSTQCLSCFSGDSRALAGGSPGLCKCNTNYFDNGISSCLYDACQYTCSTCVDATNMCLSCSTSNQRTLAGPSPNLCLCNTGYYDNSVTNCAVCNYSCFTCTDQTQNCVSCSANYNRTLAGPSPNICQCNIGFYDSGISKCASCHYSCLNCVDSTTKCVSCSSSQFRALAGKSPNVCQCNVGFFDNGVSVCATCDFSCLTCVDSTKQCMGCSQTNQRTLYGPPPSMCQCNTGFFESQTSICSSCHFSCLTCSDNTLKCLSCSKINFRTMNGTSPNLCLCSDGYFDNGINVCAKCSPACLTCVGSTSSQCLSCNLTDHKVFIKNSCACNNSSYYQDQNYICHLCYPTCKTCSNGQINGCLSCDILTYRFLVISKCDCLNGYEDQNDNCLKKQDITGQTQSYKPECAVSNCANCPSDVCKSCSPGYFQQDSFCVKCNDRCATCTGITVKECTQCAYIKKQGQCILCEEMPGLHTIQNICQSICGDGVVYPPTEECDNGSLMMQDGCTAKCKNETYYINATLSYVDQFTSNKLQLNFSKPVLQANFCSTFTLTIDSGQFSFASTNNSQISCSITIFFASSLPANEIIKVDYLNNTLFDKKNMTLIETFVTTRSRKFTYYSAQQLALAQSSQSAQSNLQLLMLLIGVLVLLVGGVEVYWSILDIMTWIDTLYYLNVDYPLNIQLFYKYSSWTSIFYLPNPLSLNQSTDKYYQQGPPKFHQKGIDSCFMASIMSDLYVCIVGLAVYIVSYITCVIMERKYQKAIVMHTIQLTDVFQPELELKIPTFLKPIYNQCKSIKDGYMDMILKLVLLVFLDFQTASILQLQAGGFTKHPFISANIILAILFQMGGIYLPFFYYSVIYKSPLLLDKQYYQEKYSAIYEDVEINSQTVMKKTMFVFFVAILYKQPVLQTIMCTLSCCINVMLMCYKNPFQERSTLYRNLILEFAIFGSIAITIVFAIDDQIGLITSDTKYRLGWAILFFIMSAICLQVTFLLKIIMLKIYDRLRKIIIWLFIGKT